MKILISTLVLVAALTGCAGFLPPQHEALLASSSSCCKDFSTLPFQDLSKEKTIRAPIGPDTPTFLFTQGKSFFLAARIKDDVSATLTVRTFAQNMLYNRNGHVLVPRITFLSADFKVISSVAPNFSVQDPRFGIGESSWRADLALPSQARYLVIHTGPGERGKVMRMRDNEQIGGYLYTRTGPAGEVEIELQ